MEKFIITPKMLSHAKTYMPLATKSLYAKTIAKEVIGEIPTADQNVKGEEILALPNLRFEDVVLKKQRLMEVFLGFYFGINVFKDKNGKDRAFGEEEYDIYGRSHIFNQVERYKHGDLKDVAFDLLYDFKEFRKMLDFEIAVRKEVNNDTLSRFLAGIQTMSNPENIKELVSQLKGEGQKLTDILREKKIIGQQKRVNAEKGVSNE